MTSLPALVALSLLTAACAPSASAPLAARPPRSLEVGVGARVGLTVNNDQLVAGPELELAGVGHERIAIALPLLAGMGDDYLTARFALEARPRLIAVGSFLLYPTVGAAAQLYTPVGPYAEYCARYRIDACNGTEAGLELGGGVRIGWFGVDAVAGFGGLPVLTTVASLVVPLDARLHLLRSPLESPP